MISRLFFLLFCGHVALNPGNAQKLPRVKRQSLKVQINTTGDTICMKYLRPNPNTKLEGFIVGYGSSFYSNQYIPLPADGKSYMTEVDAEPRYLIVVRPARTSNKKTCSGQTKMSKPLQLVVGTLTPSSVFLSWGILVNPHHDWTAMSNCASDRFYTVRYREKDKNKKWAFQLCPATETVVENLKPNTLYEFGVKDNTEDGIWSKSFNHKTVLSSKAISGQLQNTYKVVPNGQTQLTLRDPKNLVPVTIIKQVIQNITQRTSPKTTDRDRSSLPILVHLIIPGLNESLKKLPPALSIEDISQTVEKKLSKNETLLWPAESKTPEVQELSPQSLPGTSEPLQESIIPTVSGALEKSEASLAHSERASRLEETKSTSKPELAHTPTTLATSKLPELPKTKTSPPLRKPAGTLVTSKVPELPKTKTSPPLLKPTGTLVTSKLPEFPVTKTSPPLLKPTGSLVFTDKQPVLPSPTTSDEPEISAPKPEKSELPLDSPTAKVSNLLKWPKATLAPNETSLVPSKLKPSATPEVQHVKPAPKPPLLEHSTPKTSRITDLSKTTLAPRETKFVPSTTKPTARPKMPRTRPAPSKAKPAPSKPKVSLQPEEPKTKPAPKETRRVPSKPKATQSPEMLSTKPVLEPITFRTEKPKATLAPKDARRVYSKPSKTVPGPGVLPTKAGPKETRRVPLKPKTTPSPDVPQTKTAPKETRLVPSKPKTSLRPEGPQTKAAPKTTSFGSINLHLVHIVDGSKVTLVPNETAQTSFNAKTARTPENPLLKTASDVVHTGTSSPKIAKPFGKPEATLAPHKVQLPSARSKASDKPHSRSALSRTTPGPGRTKTPGILRWDGPTTDGLTEEDIVKFTGKDLGISWESSVSKKRPISEMLPPDSKHPLLAPAKPTQVRRKPLPPNTVTGKPGSPVNVLVPQVPPSPMATMAQSAKPTNFVKTGAPRKSPTASATPEDFADATVFSSSPTSETDSLGKPRYTAPHVKYMKKEEDVPCSITSSLEYFPQEEGGSKEEPVQPPQNPPTNLTVVTVEGCPSFVILDWEKPDNDTVTEYEVVSTENGAPTGKEQSIITTNQTHSTVENLKPDTSYEFHVKPRNPLGEGPSSNTVAFNTESADPRVSEPISMGKDAIWTPIPFESDSYSECRGKQYVKRTWYKKFVGVQLCNSLRYKIYLSDSLTGKFYNIGDQRGHGEDHCQFVDSFLDGRTGQQVLPEQLPVRDGFFRAVRQEPVKFGEIGGQTHINYVHWYECGTSIPGKW